MRKFGRFLAVGTIFSTVEEFLTVIVIRGDVGSYVFTLLILFPAFLTIVYFGSRFLDRCFENQATRELAHFFGFGALGLLIEWFPIGLSPWSDRQANWALMFLFQLGMFSFWATVAFAPRLFTMQTEAAERARGAIQRFYTRFFVGVYIVAMIVPRKFKFGVIIAMIIFGYTFLNYYYARYFRERSEPVASA